MKYIVSIYKNDLTEPLSSIELNQGEYEVNISNRKSAEINEFIANINHTLEENDERLLHDLYELIDLSEGNKSYISIKSDLMDNTFILNKTLINFVHLNNLYEEFDSGNEEVEKKVVDSMHISLQK